MEKLKNGTRGDGRVSRLGLGVNLMFYYGFGFGFGSIWSHIQDDTPEKVREAQQQNSQITALVEKQFPSKQGLLVGGENTFTFRATNQEGQEIKCQGTFESNRSVVTKIADVTCSQSFKVGK